MIKILVENNGYSNGLILFHQKSFPSRNSKIYLNYIFSSSPFAEFIEEKFVIAIDSNEIVGEILSIPAKYHYKEINEYSVFGCDYLVILQYRNTGTGKALLKKLLKSNNYFAIGSNPSGMSYKLHIALGQKHIADSIIYFFPNLLRPLTILYSILKRFNLIRHQRLLKTFVSPPMIIIGTGTFKLISDLKLISENFGYKNRWNYNLLEFDRSIEYLKWRFFESPYQYYFYEYRSSNKPKEIDGYIVFRPVKYKDWFDTILVVDYRFNTNNPSVLKNFIKFSKHILSLNSIGFLLFSNSLKQFDSIFRKRMLKIYSYPILSNIKIYSDQIDVFATFADADADLNKSQLF